METYVDFLSEVMMTVVTLISIGFAVLLGCVIYKAIKNE